MESTGFPEKITDISEILDTLKCYLKKQEGGVIDYSMVQALEKKEKNTYYIDNYIQNGICKGIFKETNVKYFSTTIQTSSRFKLIEIGSQKKCCSHFNN